MKIIRKIFAIFLTLSVVFSNQAVINAEEQTQTSDNSAISSEVMNSIDAKSAVLMEVSSGQVLIEKNAHESYPPASVTKVMTILLTYEALEQGKIKPEDIVTISEHAAGMGGSQVFLEPNEQQNVQDLLKCVIIASANDAAVALAEKISGSEEAFVSLMNERAKQLGMKNTVFKNACGLDIDGHVTSSYDIALMTRELAKNHPKVFDYTKIWQDTITHVTKRGASEFGLTNTNKLIKMYPYATGLKTGSTGAALFCLSATAKEGDMELIAVIMGSPSSKIRFDESIKLLNNGFSNYAVSKGESAGTKKGDVPVYKGKKHTVEALVKEEVKALTKKGQTTELASDIKLYEFVDAPLKKGDVVGEINYTFNGQPAGKSDLVSGEDIEKLGFFDTMINLIGKWV